MRLSLLSLLILATASWSSDAVAFEQTVLEFRSIQDPAVPPDASVCARAPFPANAQLGASLHAFTSRASDGVVLVDDGPHLGEGTACLRITDTTFPPFSTVPYYSELTLDRVGSARNVRLTMSGHCTITSNDIPVPRLMLAACSLVIAPAPGIIGGIGSSNSVFNAFRLPGFDTGSNWTLRLFPE